MVSVHILRNDFYLSFFCGEGGGGHGIDALDYTEG